MSVTITKPYYHWQDNSLILMLQIQTRATKNTVIGPHGDRLKVAITAPPIEGKANKYLVKFLATYFDVPQNQVKIAKGETTKYKTVLIIQPKNHLADFKN